jgi:multidrug efflux pump subunit AcrB
MAPPGRGCTSMIRWFAHHPTAANLLLVLMIAAGLFSVPHLKRETFPDYRPGGGLHRSRVSRAPAPPTLKTPWSAPLRCGQRVEYLDEFVASAQDNVARATATMAAGGDPVRFLNELQTEVQAITDLPARAETPVVRELHRNDLVAS